MSTEKKNKGRPREALANDNIASRLVQKFMQMGEDDFTRSVVIPVLEKQGFLPVDFHHGPTEVGKDLIFYREKGFGKKAIIVAVVKMDRLSKSASDKSGFPTVLIQAAQAKNNKVLAWDGTRRPPDELFVILADDPSHDILSSSPDYFQQMLAQGVTFIRGSEVATELLSKRSDIAEQLLESKLDTSRFLREHPTNLPLLNALNSNDLVDVGTIFTNLDAAVGATRASEAFFLSPSKSVSNICVSEPSWDQVAGAIRQMEELLGPLLVEPLDKLERIHAIRNAEATTPANIALRQELEYGVAEILKWIQNASLDFGARSTAIADQISKLSKRDHRTRAQFDIALDIANEIKNGGKPLNDQLIRFGQSGPLVENLTALPALITQYLTLLDESDRSLEEIGEGWFNEGVSAEEDDRLTVYRELRRTIAREVDTATQLLSESKDLAIRVKSFKQPEDYEVRVDSRVFADRISGHVSILISRFSSPLIATDKQYARQLLEDTRRYLMAVDSFVRNKELGAVLVPTRENDGERPKLGACVMGLLDSGLDVLLTGVAGSGKSTTLDMFARKRYSTRAASEEVLFFSLAKVALPPSSDDSKKEAEDDIARRQRVERSLQIRLAPAEPKEEDVVKHLCDEQARLLQMAQPGVTSQFVRDHLESAKKVVLVLDGVDEAASLIPWLVKVIVQMRRMKGNMLQVVASSRFAVPELADAGLFNIVLLPFKPEQVVRFVTDFLQGEPDLAQQVIAHLEANPNLFSVSKTPLMSTILCVLARNGVALPETKHALFKERFELLWGAYDAKKQVRRVFSSRSCLEDVSKKVAYYLHTRHKRSESSETLLAYLIETLAPRRYRDSVVQKAFSELERPCNVLFHEAGGSMSFGHLSYQEYLAADELYSNRQAEIVKYLSDPWWRGALVLAAMKTDDIGTIIEDRLVNTGNIGDAEETLAAMIAVCDDSQQKVLGRVLRKQKKLDSIAWLELDDGT